MWHEKCLIDMINFTLSLRSIYALWIKKNFIDLSCFDCILVSVDSEYEIENPINERSGAE